MWYLEILDKDTAQVKDHLYFYGCKEATEYRSVHKNLTKDKYDYNLYNPDDPIKPNVESKADLKVSTRDYYDSWYNQVMSESEDQG